MLGSNKLVGVGTPFVANGNGFPSPDQLTAALTEPLPATKRAFRGTSVVSPVPTFHGLNANPIPNGQPVARKGFEQRCVWADDEFIVTWNVETQRVYVLFESGNALHASQTKNACRGHAEAFRCCGSGSTARAPSSAKPTRTKHDVV